MGLIFAKTDGAHLRMSVLVPNNGKLRKLEDIDLADQITMLRQTKDPWEVIDALVKVWAKKAPDEVTAVKIDIDDQREMVVDKKYGQTLGGKDFERRFTLLFPSSLQQLIRTQYRSEELPFSSTFFKEFAKRYPSFKVAQEV